MAQGHHAVLLSMTRSKTSTTNFTARALQEADSERLVDAGQVPIEVIPAAPHGDNAHQAALASKQGRVSASGIPARTAAPNLSTTSATRSGAM